MKLVKINDILYSKDSVTRKYIQVTNDNHKIETLFVDYNNKYIICFSTQIGCNLGCKFCYNGLQHNFKRNLTSTEMCEQIENVIENENPSDDKPILFSAMGIGEPLLNYDNLIKAFNYLNSKYNNTKFALATTGIATDKILKLVNDLKNIKNFKLTISLHAASEEKRNKLMPSCNDINSLVQTVNQYKLESGREAEWNYVLLNGINDTKNDVKGLYKLLGRDAYIKLNRYNKVKSSNLIESENFEEFTNELKKYGIKYEYYETNGADIDGACGQMVAE